MKWLVLAVGMTCFYATADAQIYKWVDENGKVQYTDQPPPPGIKQPGQRLQVNPTTGTKNNSTSSSRSVAEDRLEFDQRQQKRKEEAAKQQAQADENKKKCIDAQGQLRIYTDSPRITVPDGAGGIKFIDDDVRQKKVEEANKAIAKYCK